MGGGRAGSLGWKDFKAFIGRFVCAVKLAPLKVSTEFNMSSFQDEELPDDRQHCCSIQTGGREHIVLSMDSRADLLHLEKAWYHTSNTAVRRLVVSSCCFRTFLNLEKTGTRCAAKALDIWW